MSSQLSLKTLRFLDENCRSREKKLRKFVPSYINVRYKKLHEFGLQFSFKRRIREYETFVRQRYSNITDETLDGLVEELMREFPNCAYKRMTGLLLNSGHRIQQNRIRECMRRVNPEGVLLRVLELRTVRRRRYQVSGPLALWHIDGNHKLIR